MLSHRLILFLVTRAEREGQGANSHVLTWAWGRESAKRTAQNWMGGDPEQYVVTPLTTPGDRIHLDINLNV